LKKSILFFITIFVAMGLLLTSCGGRNSETTPTDNPSNQPGQSSIPAKEKTTANIVGLKGPTSMGMVRIFAEVESLSDYVDVEYDIVNSPELITAGLLNGEIDIAAIPTNLAANLYNKTEGGITMLGVNTLGVIHIVAEKSLNIEDLEDLRGKTIGATGKGSVPEFVLNYLLSANGLEPGKDVEIEYRTDHSELATLVELGEVDIALLPQPFVTTVLTKNDDYELAIDLTDVWRDTAPEGSELTMGCLVANSEFAAMYQQELIQLLVVYNDSVNWVNAYPKEAAQAIVEFGILPSVEIAEAAIPESNIVYIFSQNSKEMLTQFYEILFESEPKSIGGAVPGEDFYFLN